MRIFRFLSALVVILFVTSLVISCGNRNNSTAHLDKEMNNQALSTLNDSINKIIADYDAEIGVAVILNSQDTLSINNTIKYPMMSVFKLHQGIALCDNFSNNNLDIDSIISIQRKDLNLYTWSPMLKDHSEDVLKIPVKELVRYAVTQSDNNASNLMFDRLVSPEMTDSMIATLIPRSDFKIAFSEEEMFHDHSKAYSNYTSPRGAAALINSLMTDSILPPKYKGLIVDALKECKTGQDRIVKPLFNEKGVSVAHKTGSGYRNEDGRLAAHNDVAFISLPDGQHYALAIFVKDIKGDETIASEAIARISETIYLKLKNLQ